MSSRTKNNKKNKTNKQDKLLSKHAHIFESPESIIKACEQIKKIRELILATNDTSPKALSMLTAYDKLVKTEQRVLKNFSRDILKKEINMDDPTSLIEDNLKNYLEGPEEDKQCCNCKKEPEARQKFKTCNGCKLLKYCSIECQKNHWKAGHKQKCREIHIIIV
jgi:hypothetical protein